MSYERGNLGLYQLEASLQRLAWSVFLAGSKLTLLYCSSLSMSNELGCVKSFLEAEEGRAKK